MQHTVELPSDDGCHDPMHAHEAVGRREQALHEIDAESCQDTFNWICRGSAPQHAACLDLQARKEQTQLLVLTWLVSDALDSETLAPDSLPGPSAAS